MHRPRLLIAMTSKGPQIFHSGNFIGEILFQSAEAAARPHDERGKATRLGAPTTPVEPHVLAALTALDLTTTDPEAAIATATTAARAALVNGEIDHFGNVKKPAEMAARVADHEAAAAAGLPVPDVNAKPAVTPLNATATASASTSPAKTATVDANTAPPITAT